MKLLFIAFITLLGPFLLYAKTPQVHLAVASNFRGPTEAIVKKYHELFPDRHVVASYGSTGKHYTQILNGAPYDIYLAADDWRPKKLQKEKQISRKHRFTYAIGELVLWSSQSFKSKDFREVLTSSQVQYIAIANPKHAPYGQAAIDFLKDNQLLSRLKKKLIYGENVSQVYHYVHTGNATLGFIPRWQAEMGSKNSHFIKLNSSPSIIQEALLINDNQNTQHFKNFLMSQKASSIIRNYGYLRP